MTTEFATGRPGSAQALADVVDRLEIHLQPVIDIATGAVWAYEALARFGAAAEPVAAAAEPAASAADPDAASTLGAAHRAGYGDELEAACHVAALARRSELPAGAHLALNVSPAALVSPAVLAGWPADLTGVLVEITEHYLASNERAGDELERLRARGARIAVDDVGSGYAGLLRLAALHPDVVKLDRMVVSRARDTDARRAVLETLVAFAHRIGARVVGEGAPDDRSPTPARSRRRS
jgi:EAL domain-containing protein (putative c-di-GMP-specific phosphodiesterase class I)